MLTLTARILRAFAAPAFAILVTVLLLALLGHSPSEVLRGLFIGSVGSLDGLAETAGRTVPLLLLGTGAAVAFGAGVWNIGGEGQFVIGAASAVALAGLSIASPALLMLAGAAAGAALAVSASLLRAWRGVNIVISTLLLNFVVIQLLGYLVRGPLQEAAAQYPQTDALPEALRLPRLLEGTRLHAGLPIALLLCVALSWLLPRTVFGFRLRAMGLGREAVALSGIDVDRHAHLAMAIAGGLGGLAGAVEVMGVTYRLYETFPSGAGYTGIAVALLARLDLAFALPSAALFGAMDASAGFLQRELRISSAVAELIQGTMIIGLLVAEYVIVKMSLRKKARSSARGQEES